MKITQFDRASCALIQHDLLAAAQAVAVKYGLAAKPAKGGRYASTYYISGSFEFNTAMTDGTTIMDKAAADFTFHCRRYNLSPTDLGRVFCDRNMNRYKIVGINTRSKRYPILCENMTTGKRYKFGASTVVSGLASLPGGLLAPAPIDIDTVDVNDL